ncbi:hypothetical protein [Streptomyces buecherae]|uniref:hypothetical protein n=1 Tax=Streptomyces buecherae TaxID=2763006 RepID=UPI00378DA7ED
MVAARSARKASPGCPRSSTAISGAPRPLRRPDAPKLDEDDDGSEQDQLWPTDAVMSLRALAWVSRFAADRGGSVLAPTPRERPASFRANAA